MSLPPRVASFSGVCAAPMWLFLGLSFDSPHPEVIATATPARLPEYMASGRPLLVHSPAGSHAAEYARSEDFAEAVDQPDEQLLGQALRRLIQ